MDTPVKLDGQAMLEAIEIDDPFLDGTLAAKLGTELTAAQQVPCLFFSFGLVMPQLANGWVGMRMTPSITAERTGAKGPIGRSHPSPGSLRSPPSPHGEG